jgi:hypothetical protein
MFAADHLEAMAQRLRWMAIGGLITLVLAAGAAVGAVTVGAPKQLADLLLGPRLARLEAVVVQGGQVHDYRVDRGRLKSPPHGTSLELRELDGTVQVVPVATYAQITVNGKPAPLTSISVGMTVTTVRDGSNPAQQVIAEGRGGKR